MGYCSSKHLDNALLHARKEAEEAKQIAREAGIFPKVRAILSNSCSKFVKGHGITVYVAHSGGYGVKDHHGKVVYHAVIESAPTDFHYGSWILALDKVLADTEVQARARVVEHNKKGWELRQLRKNYSL